MGSSADKHEKEKKGAASASVEEEKKSVAKAPKINPEHIVTTKSRPVFEGSEETTTLGLEDKKREEMLKQIPLVFSLLKRNKMNPIAEEGKFASLDERDHKGEYFITPEAFALLLYRDKQKYAARENKDAYNIENVIEIDNNPEQFCDLLRKLNLKEGEDLKVTYIEKVHACPCYLRMENGRIRCYIADSNGATSQAKNIVRYLKGSLDFPDITIGPFIQPDYYSCFTFARKFYMYVIKHGKDLFPHIDKVGTTFDPVLGCNMLSAENLMPALLKFCQSHPKLGDEALDTIVSQKKGESLRQQLAEHEIKIGDKRYNTGALKNRWEKLFLLKDIISQLGVTEISSDERVPLPAPIVEAIKGHYIGPKERPFTKVCEEIADFVNEERKESQLSPLAATYLDYLTKKFPDFKEWCKDCFAQYQMVDQLQMEDESVETFNFTANLRKILFISYAASYYFQADQKDKIMEHVINVSDILIRICGVQDVALATLLEHKPLLSPEALEEAVGKIYKEYLERSLAQPRLDRPPGV